MDHFFANVSSGAHIWGSHVLDCMLRCDTPAQGSSAPPPAPPPGSWRNGARSPSKHLQGHVDTQLHVLHVVVMLLFNQILLAGTIPTETVDTVVTRFIVLLMIY